MRVPLLFLCVSFPAALAAAEPSFTAHELNTPVFDTAGHLIRRLTAAKVSGSAATPRLDQGRVDFFDLASAEDPVTIATFDQALYARATERITGDGLLSLASAPRQETITGRGYACEIAAGQLTLQSEVRFTAPRFHLTGDRAEVRFDPKAVKDVAAIQTAVVTGKVVVERPGPDGERAETTLARYDAAQQKIYLQSPVTSWRRGVKTVNQVGSGFVEIDLATPPKSTTPAKDSAAPPIARPVNP